MPNNQENKPKPENINMNAANPLTEEELDDVTGGRGRPPQKPKYTCKSGWSERDCFRNSFGHCDQLVIIDKKQEFLHAHFILSCQKGFFQGISVEIRGI